MSATNPFEPQLSDVFVTNSRGHGLYRGGTFGVRKRSRRSTSSKRTNVLAKDEDDDSNERDRSRIGRSTSYDLSLD